MLKRVDGYFNEQIDARFSRVCCLFLGLSWLLLLSDYRDLSSGLATWALGRPPALGAWASLWIPGIAVALLCFLVGWRARLAGALAAAALLISYLMASNVFHNNTYLAWLLLVIVLVGPSSAYGVSWLLTNADPLPSAALPVRLVRWQMIIVYGYAVLSKVTDPLWTPLAGTLGRPPVTAARP